MSSALVLLLLPAIALAMEFSAYVPSDQYKCGAFQKDRIDDKLLTLYYRSIDQLIGVVSNPFPHSELLSRRALTGDLKEIQESVTTKYDEWISWQRGWLILAGIPLVLSVIFPIFYLLYRCCLCCCCSSKPVTTDRRYDPCKRNLLNLLIAFFVIVDVFATATILITGQYAQFGIEELPGRLSSCVDDLTLYKTDTDMRIRKLLIEDYQTMNRTMSQRIQNAGHNIVNRVKKHTGAQVIDTLLNISRNAQEVKESLVSLREDLQHMNNEANRFDVEFTRLRKTATEELLACVQNEVDPVKAMCHKAERLLTNLQNAKFHIEADVLGANTDEALDSIINADIPSLLQPSNDQFAIVEVALQNEINKKTSGAQNTLKQIGDDLFVVAEKISTTIRQVNFDDLYKAIAVVSDEKSPITKYMSYSYYGSLVIAGIYMILAFTFLFGLVYGICGRRPSYYDDDCCVRSTGGKFFSCGIWTAMLFFTVLAAITAVLILVIGNSSNIVCQTLRDPLSRPDTMSLLERYEEIWKSNRKNNASNNELFEHLDKYTPADIIRACQRNETFYYMFDIDKKYHLNQLKEFEKDSYKQLEQFLEQSLAELNVKAMDNIISEENSQRLAQLGSFNVSQLSEAILSKIKGAIDELNFAAKAKAFTEQIDSSAGRPRAISSILEQIDEIDIRIAKPLRENLEVLYRNLTALNSKLSDMQIPVESLLSRLQHAQALLSDGIMQHFEGAAKEELNATMSLVDQYIDHVGYEMNHDVSSCVPIVQIADSSTAAICGHTIDPLNGTWMAMLISLLCLIPIIIFSTHLVNLYNHMHSYPKYIVEAPSERNEMTSFMTDTYDFRHKPGYANHSYTDDYQRTYR